MDKDLNEAWTKLDADADATVERNLNEAWTKLDDDTDATVERDLNKAWIGLDDDADATMDLSEENLEESTRNYQHSTESQSRENRSFQNTPTRGTESDSNRGGSTITKRMRPAHSYDILGMSLLTVVEAMRNFGLDKEVNRTSKVFDILEEVRGLTNSKFIEVGQLMSRDDNLASFFVSLRPERCVDWLKKTLSDLKGNDGGASS